MVCVAKLLTIVRVSGESEWKVAHGTANLSSTFFPTGGDELGDRLKA